MMQSGNNQSLSHHGGLAINPYYAYDPTPGNQFHVSPTPSSVAQQVPSSNIVLGERLGRRKRSTDIIRDRVVEKLTSDGILNGIVNEVVTNLLDENQKLGEVKATIKPSRSVDPINYHFNIPKDKDPYEHGHPHFDHVHDFQHPEHTHDKHFYPSTVSTHELPAPAGCRSLATKECERIPVFVPRKVPYDVCHTVPDIECVRILKSVPELQCTPETYRECNDVETKVPYFELEEQCEEVVFDECVLVRSSLHYTKS